MASQVKKVTKDPLESVVLLVNLALMDLQVNLVQLDWKEILDYKDRLDYLGLMDRLVRKVNQVLWDCRYEFSIIMYVVKYVLYRSIFFFWLVSKWIDNLINDTDKHNKSKGTRNYRVADKSLAWPGRKQATATEDFDVHISYL